MIDVTQREQSKKKYRKCLLLDLNFVETMMLHRMRIKVEERICNLSELARRICQTHLQCNRFSRANFELSEQLQMRYPTNKGNPEQKHN